MKINLTEEFDDIVVPQEKPDKKITVEVENYLLDFFAEDIYQPYTYKELWELAQDKYGGKYGNLKPHVMWAIDSLHFNNLIKRVGPNVYESIDGPDETYSERETGHASPGEYATRGYDVRGIRKAKNKAEFNRLLFAADFGIRQLKNLGKKKDEIEQLLVGSHEQDPVAVKLALKKYFT